MADGIYFKTLTMLETINLKCANCGSNLEVKAETETFACGYCGVSQIVERHGGTISLKVLTDSISKVQIGTDKTAAELAIRRMKEEISEIDIIFRQINARMSKEKTDSSGMFIAGFLILCIYPCCYLFTASPWIALLIITGAGAVMFYFWQRKSAEIEDKYAPELNPLIEKYKLLEEKIAKQKEIVDS